DEAVGILDAGGLVAFPTETVYGLGADASNTRAVSRVFEVKGRPEDHPLIVHLGCSSAIDHWARKIPQAAWRLADAFWPGPMTLVLSRAAGVSDAVTGGTMRRKRRSNGSARRRWSRRLRNGSVMDCAWP
ncbi:MAG: L-threonylcarbamoyladenylate synthase, partial [Wenzhouxiangellaceae bacterium]